MSEASVMRKISRGSGRSEFTLRIPLEFSTAVKMGLAEDEMKLGGVVCRIVKEGHQSTFKAFGFPTTDAALAFHAKLRYWLVKACLDERISLLALDDSLFNG
jgi:hypothetical protein